MVVLISGGGSNLLSLLETCQDAEFPARVVAVGSDREADGFEHAARFGIPTFTVTLPSFATRDQWGDELVRQVRVFEPDLVVLSGFMMLLPTGAVTELRPNLINTHPAYLPEFPGPHAVRDALAAGVSETGASVIVVDEGVDTGPIIAQERIRVADGETEHALHDRIRVVERRLLAQVILDFANGRIDLGALR